MDSIFHSVVACSIEKWYALPSLHSSSSNYGCVFYRWMSKSKKKQTTEPAASKECQRKLTKKQEERSFRGSGQERRSGSPVQ
ncbi:hypothetical protein GCK32_020347 [Trichostrongylus colubriformis]|uniref:Uncharacterized protein n=1 Tax=Trichostrongylus colubriformis TaxID=6319 RepID=A0AAN8F2Q4_TRICO